uniref:Roadblock/LAMTOR2 domain-containing protein n=1 Tax=Thermofilum pendens TaxID=2269 RepID=A0A7C4FF25_THEPE
MSKPLVEIEELTTESVTKLLLSLGAERVAVFSEDWKLLFAHPTEEEGDSLKSIGASLSIFLDESSPWLFLRREERTVVLVKVEGAFIVVEGDIKPSDADLVVLLGRLLVE